MPKFPSSLKIVPYSQRPSFLGVVWQSLANIDVDHYELFISPKSLGDKDIGALLMGQKEKDGVVKVPLPASCSCVVDNMSPQAQRGYYTVFAVDTAGDFYQAIFQVNDLSNLDLKDPHYLKEPFTPSSLKFIPYGQKPDGIGVSWEMPKGDWASYRVVVLTGKSINQPQDFEKLFAGQLDFARMYEVPAGANEAIDDASPQGSRNYYSVVAVDKKGNMIAVSKFQTVEGSQAKFKAPVRLSGKAAAPPVAAAAPQAAPKPTPAVAPRPEVALTAAPKPVVAAAPTPRTSPTTRYPSRLSTIPSTQHLLGTRIRIKQPRTDLAYRIVVASKSINDPVPVLEGKTDFARVCALPSDATEFIDNVTEPYTRCYYAVLGVDASGNYTELPFEVVQPRNYDIGGAKFLDPGRRWALPTVDADWLLKTMEKGIEAVPHDPHGRTVPNIGPYVNQVWEGTRIRIKGAKKEYVRYQILLANNYIKKDKVAEAVQGRSDYIKAYEVPTESLELIDNLSQTGTKVYLAVIGWDKEGNGYDVEVEIPSTQYAEFKSPRFVDPSDLARVKAAADEMITLGRKTLAGIGTDKQSLYTGGPNAIQTAVQCGQRARLVYPMYSEIDRFKEEVIDRNGWLVQARAQFECDDAFTKAEVALKGDRQPYAFPNYSSVEENLKTFKQKQDEAKAHLQKHISEAPWSSKTAWYGERLKQLDGNDARAKKLVAHMEELKARDVKAKGIYDQARAAHSAERFDEAIKLYGDVMKVKPEWDTNGDIERAKDDKEFAGQIAAAGTTLSKFKAIYDDWMGRGKSSYAWNALGKAFARIADKDSFLLYERELFKHGHYSDVVNLFRDIRASKEGFLDGIFGAAKVKDAGLQMEELDAELRRIDGTVRDMDGKLGELQREDSKLIGSGYSDHRTNLQNDMERLRRAMDRERERAGEIWKRMATILSELFGG